MIEVIKIHDKDYGNFHALASNGQLLIEANRFLIWKKDHGGRGGQKLSTGSQRQYAYHLKYLFDTIMQGPKPKQWFELTIQDLLFFRDQMDQGDDGLDRGVINIRTQLWAEFFFWCRRNGYDHNMHIKTIKRKIHHYNNNDDFLAHTGKDKFIYRTELWLTPIDKSRVFRTISQSTWNRLRKELFRIDPIYEAIAIVMINTGLRISGALQLNKTTFLPYPDLNPEEELTFWYIPKGQMDSKRKYSCIFPIDTWGWLHKNIMNERQKRAKLYKKKFEKHTQHLFLKKSGKPVQDFDVWQAFKTASENLKTNITPHMLRHTFATWTVIVWAEQEGVRPTTETFYKSIHDQLSQQLGHKHISTTKIYCRTASMLEFKKIMPKVTSLAMEKPHIKRSFETLSSYGFSVGI